MLVFKCFRKIWKTRYGSKHWTASFFWSGGTGGTLGRVPPVKILGIPESDPTETAEPSTGFRPCIPWVPPVCLQKFMFVFLNSSNRKTPKSLCLVRNIHPNHQQSQKNHSFHLNKPKTNSRQNLNSNFVLPRNPSKGSLNQTLKSSHDYFALSA